MIALLKDLWWSLRYPWPRSAIEGRLRALRISVCSAEQHPDCLALYERNVSHGIPRNEQEHYLSVLREGSVLTLVAEEAGHVVGTFGVSYGPLPEMFFLSYLLVSPEHHQRGFGTTLILAALALLPENHPDLKLGLFAVPTAARFYERFGFLRGGEVPHPSGQIHQFSFLPITSAMTHACRKWLSAAGATLPDSNYEIPGAKE